MASHHTITWERHEPTPSVSRGLWSAARTNNLAELAHLIDAGCAINERDERGYAPLMLAAYWGHVEALELLLSGGADPNTTDLFGNTVLMAAAFKGHMPVVRRLLMAGADAMRGNHGGLDACGLALAYGHVEVSALLHQVSRSVDPLLARLGRAELSGVVELIAYD